jgi:hypothetical protein
MQKMVTIFGVVVILWGTPLDYLNTLRQKSGLIALRSNALLQKSAYNHARYLDRYNEGGHREKRNKPYTTGQEIAQRARYVGYRGGVLENVSISRDAKRSIDDLFSAIYHRFSFLNLHIDEIGMASIHKYRKEKLSTFVYNMGNSKLTKVCSRKPYEGYGTIYSGICSEPSFKLKEGDYLKAHHFNAKRNPAIVLYPYRDAKDVPIVFYEESPDPLPSCRVSGYPVSVEFNPTLYKKVSLLSFQLYDNRDESVELARLLTKATDPNNRLNTHQFAFMPLRVFDFDKTYRVKVLYAVDGDVKKLEWSFHTQKPQYTLLEVKRSKQLLTIKSGKGYWIYFKPKDCNDIYRSINSSFPQNVTIEHHFVNSNTLYFRVKGRKGDRVKCRMSSRKEFVLEIE